MKTGFVTDIDYERLLKLIQSFKVEKNTSTHLKKLWYELKNLKMIQSKKVPANIVTMNSQILIKDIKSLEEKVIRLVYPTDSNIPEGKISIISTLGIAIFGSKEGDVISIEDEGEIIQYEILSIVYQPEKFGDFHL